MQSSLRYCDKWREGWWWSQPWEQQGNRWSSLGLSFLVCMMKEPEQSLRKVPASCSKSAIFHYPQLQIIMNGEDISCFLQSYPTRSSTSSWRFQISTCPFTSSEPLLVLPSPKSAGEHFPLLFQSSSHVLKAQLKSRCFQPPPAELVLPSL